MNLRLSAEAGQFFTKHGFVELDIGTPSFTISEKRDAWRKNAELKKFLLKTVGLLALSLSGKTSLHLACDQGFLAKNLPKGAAPIKEIVCFQGLSIGVAIAFEPKQKPRDLELGIVPAPSGKGRVLFFRSDLILDWPHLESDVYIALYALSSGVYVQNMNDPFTNELKSLGYHFGERLKNEHHPLILKR